MAFDPRKTQTALAEINVTPLVDVMLVLLVVFMISAPLMQQGVEINLPKANSAALSESPDQVFLSLKANREIHLNGAKIPPGTLRAKLEAMSKVKPELQVFIQADQTLPYGLIAQLMAEVKQARITRVGLVTEPGSNPKF